MRKLHILILITALFVCCKKEEKSTVSGCAIEMKQKFDKELTCNKENSMATNLYIALYKGDIVYFPKIMCPACNSIPPPFGYTCTNKKVTFKNFSDVTDIKIVYNSCTKEYTK